MVKFRHKDEYQYVEILIISDFLKDYSNQKHLYIKKIYPVNIFSINQLKTFKADEFYSVLACLHQRVLNLCLT